ncbi:menaquinone-dependent protoporphyrinogen IX dehydrogenase [Hafnia alvei]|uniref:Protoporphyrinogen IX dehydrogenase [quinone] n=1 Tax=Hafnia alvei TaxID=569 RepID=A0A1C6Z102_HAFAL|nr:menaquinone-dependent protoporphyrinogen IX dehydrogenase [Hafnia alvei]NLS54490.1 menaquinone-dependent protoporphyrinogen IX dehydrogenase [Hafnia alvei]SCM52883.1 menaquinone-dependent protoporphyrinogen oxidase [Hafnia alvei]
MKKTLVLYSSQDGQTKAIASYIASALSETTMCDVQDLAISMDIDLANYQAIVIGASVRYGHFQRALYQFTKMNTAQLNTMPSAFFAVNLTARKPEKRTPQTNAYTRKFLLATPWQPKLCSVFAGALRYPRYGWLDKFMIKLIMKMTGGETDTTKEVEYTDWQDVERFAQGFVRLTSSVVR